MPGPSDIASLDEARDRIAVLEARLDDQARARAELIHLVSHELRTPITVISGFGRLLQNEGHGPLNDEQRRFVGESLKAVHRLDDFVGDLLEARADAAHPFDVERAPVDLHEVIEAPLEALVPMLEERGMKVEVRLRASAPVLPLDARRIEQVVTNLLTNAIRYGRPAGVIRIASGDALDDPGMTRVSVEDDGPGIPVEDRERLFAPYVRGDTGEVRGLGIGLALCRRIIDAHGGRIHVEAGDLGGARFVFALPGASPSPDRRSEAAPAGIAGVNR
ncbi:MAG: HAMP domain-containing sensor histidine kinase [Myxococcota bacterium]